MYSAPGRYRDRDGSHPSRLHARGPSLASAAHRTEAVIGSSARRAAAVIGSSAHRAAAVFGFPSPRGGPGRGTVVIGSPRGGRRRPSAPCAVACGPRLKQGPALASRPVFPSEAAGLWVLPPGPGTGGDRNGSSRPAGRRPGLCASDRAHEINRVIAAGFGNPADNLSYGVLEPHGAVTVVCHGPAVFRCGTRKARAARSLGAASHLSSLMQ
jgi:hypothetical protein